MPALITPIIVHVERRRKELARLESTQLNSERARSELRQIVETYFNETRPQFSGSASESVLSSVDGKMQALLTLCHKRGSTHKYVELLSSLKKELIALDSHLVVGVSTGEVATTSPIDVRIIGTLSRLVPSASKSFEQALRDLAGEDRLSWRGPATDLRESLRETLDHLAPDSDVEGLPGYKHMEGAKHPTMKQKVRYILKSRGASASVSEPTENATDAVEEMIGKFVRSVYRRSSVSTHTHTSKDEVLRVLEFVRVVLCELLEIRR